MRLVSILFVIIFSLFALVQLNDPDPYIWVPIYGYAVLMSGMAYKGKYNIGLLALGAALYLMGSIYLFPPSVSDWIHNEEAAKSLQMKMPFVEEARESLGLLICFAVMAMYLLVGVRLNKNLKNKSAQHAEAL